MIEINERVKQRGINHRNVRSPFIYVTKCDKNSRKPSENSARIAAVDPVFILGV